MVTKKYFGSIKWQNDMDKNISSKLAKKEKLDDYEKTFIDIQREHAKRMRHNNIRG